MVSMRSDACIAGSKAHKQIDITIIRIRTPSQDRRYTDLRTTPPTVLSRGGLAPPQTPPVALATPWLCQGLALLAACSLPGQRTG